MALGRQRDHSYAKTVARERRWEVAAYILMGRRRRANYNASISQVLYRPLAKHQVLSSQGAKFIRKASRIFLSDFSFNFNGLTQLDYLRVFRFDKDDLCAACAALNSLTMMRSSLGVKVGLRPAFPLVARMPSGEDVGGESPDGFKLELSSGMDDGGLTCTITGGIRKGRGFLARGVG